MPYELDISNIILQKLDETNKQINALHGSSFLLDDAMDKEFMLACSAFDSLQALLDASGYTVHDQADFEKIPADAWDQFIAANTHYPDWQAMLDEATARYVMRRLSDGR